MPIRRKIKNSVGRYSQAELLVREATSNDPSLPSHELLIQIAEMTKFPSMYNDTVSMIWKRLNDKCKNWRHIYKSLIVIEACLRYGSSGFVKECRYQLPQILTLCDFVYSYDSNSNAGFLVREKAQRVVSLLKDENILRHERQSARPVRQRASFSQSRRPSESSLPIDDSQKRQRSQSVYNPSDEFVAKTDAEELEHIRLAMTLSLQNRETKKSTNSTSATSNVTSSDAPKPTLLESSRRAAGSQNHAEDLLILDDVPASRANRFVTWLENRSKRFSSMSTSDLGTPSSSLVDSGLNGSEKWSVASHPTQNWAALTGVKSDVLADLSGLDFGSMAISAPTSEKDGLDEYRMYPISAKTSNEMASTALPIHKTSADDFLASRNRIHNSLSYEEDVTPIPASSAAIVMSAPSAAVDDKPVSKLSTMLASHKDLVDLDNICKISKPPSSNPLGVFGETRVSQTTDNYGSLALNGFGAMDDYSHHLTSQPEQIFAPQPLVPSLATSNTMSTYQQPSGQDQSWNLLPNQTRFPDLLKPNPVAPPASTNPFI